MKNDDTRDDGMRDDDFAEMADEKVEMHWRVHGQSQPPTRWCVKGVIPETGIGILAGQWGTFKTTIALDLSLAVMTGAMFADRYRVKRQGAVAYFALEGAGMIGKRLTTLADARGIPGPFPFVWCDACTSLTAPNAASAIVAALREADVERRFGKPLSLVWVDTLATAAGYDSTGDDNDTAVTQKVMNALSAIARQTGAFVIGVDHFGKVITTGTRGSSAKEGAVDTVLAALGNRDVNGVVTETKLALRKQRDGISGVELPFAAEIIETGRDEDGDPITAVVINWNATPVAASADKWPKALKLFNRILVNALNASGQDIDDAGRAVRAVPADVIRAEFYRQHISDGTEEQRKAARQKAFVRALREAQARNLVGCGEINGIQWIWLTEGLTQ
jgi:hypothetical protein